MNNNQKLDISTIRDSILYREEFLKTLLCKLLTSDNKYICKLLSYAKNEDNLSYILERRFPHKEEIKKLRKNVLLGLETQELYKDIIVSLNSTELTEITTIEVKITWRNIPQYILSLIIYIPTMLMMNNVFQTKVTPFDWKLSFEVLKAYQIALFFYPFKDELREYLEPVINQ